MPAHFYTKDVLRGHPNYGNFRIGDYTYGAPSVKWWGEKATLSIGKFCSIAPGCDIFLGGNHRTGWVTTYPFSGLPAIFPFAKGLQAGSTTNGDVVIGNDVWIGHRVTIMSGVTIHDGAVIGANATVTKDVPPYHIAAGVPAKVINKRFKDEHIQKLLTIKWWDWDIDTISKVITYILSDDIDSFIRVASSISAQR